MKIFVPGRICLFGEHTDWAGGYRRINAELDKGYAIIVGTNQGIHADVSPHPDKLVVKARLEDGTQIGPYEVPMEREALLKEAESGGFLSYAAGVSYQILTHYRVRGLVIDNYLTDLPVQKGLSSSAAICVLVARAFNRIYDLKMTVRGEMEYAYMGEITTPSRCGRLDQGCAYGNRPIKMVFDGDRLDVKELTVPKPLYYVIVDLCAHKDTIEILSKLNHCYPFAANEKQKRVQEFLGPVSSELTHEAADAIRTGDAVRLGELMNEAQEKFDTYLAPACPSQLTAPVLHKLLNHPPLKPFVLGGKGVGSQGDGTAQLLVKDAEAQEQICKLVEHDLGMTCIKLQIQSVQRLRKAVIPVAGFGAALFPASKSMKKELFPIVDEDGRTKPVLLAIMEKAIEAGIEEIALVIQESDRQLFEDFLFKPVEIQHFNRLSKEDQGYMERILEIGERVSLIVQPEQRGFGHAIHCARDWVGEETFLLMLGDHLYLSETDQSCANQLVDLYERTGKSIVGLAETPEEEIGNFGCATGIWDESDELFSLTEFAEKPDLAYARQHLMTERVEEGKFLTLFGQYVLSSRIFDLLDDVIYATPAEENSIGLTPSLDRLRQEESVLGCRIKGSRFDVGSPESYRKTLLQYGAR